MRSCPSKEPALGLRAPGLGRWPGAWTCHARGFSSCQATYPSAATDPQRFRVALTVARLPMPTPQFFYLLSGMMLYQCKSCKISEFYGDDQQRPAGGAASFADWD